VGILEKAREYVAGLEENELNRYIVIVIGIIVLLMMTLLFYHYRTVSNYRLRIKKINQLREEKVQDILARAEYLEKQREEINTILAEDKNFKTIWYFDRVKQKLQLTNKEVREQLSQIERTDQYLESILNVTFDDIDMKQVTELLKELEENKRIFIKKLDIAKSKKIPQKLEVSMTIGTFLLKE